MREWLFALGPITTILYFVVYPQQLVPLMYWVASMVR